MVFISRVQALLSHHFFLFQQEKEEKGVEAEEMKEGKELHREDGVGLSHLTLPLSLLMEEPLRRRVME